MRRSTFIAKGNQMDGRKRGLFCVRYEWLERPGAHHLLQLVMSNMVVLRAEYRMDRAAMEYVCRSQFFDAVADGEKTPEYHLGYCVDRMRIVRDRLKGDYSEVLSVDPCSYVHMLCLPPRIETVRPFIAESVLAMDVKATCLESKQLIETTRRVDGDLHFSGE